MKRTTAERATVWPTVAPTLPRLCLQPALSRRTILDGGWWPRSSDPIAELPGLILALQQHCGPITNVILGAVGWSSRPRRLGVGDAVIRLGWFTSQPFALLTAIGTDVRVDLLVVPPDTAIPTANQAMAVAADPTNRRNAPDILPAITARRFANTRSAAAARWETGGGRPTPTATPDQPQGAVA